MNQKSKDLKRWMNDPLPDDLISDLVKIIEDRNYAAQKRAHQCVLQDLKWLAENPVKDE